MADDDDDDDGEGGRASCGLRPCSRTVMRDLISLPGTGYVHILLGPKGELVGVFGEDGLFLVLVDVESV